MTTHEVLVAAKGYLLNHGWKQGGFGWDPGGPRCMIGAVIAVNESGDALSVQQALWRAVGEPVMPWNDHSNRTFGEVIAAFDKAILATAPPLDDTPIFQALEDLPADEYIEALSVLALLPMEALA